MEAVTEFIFLGSQITVDGDCSHAIKSCLLLGRKAMTSLDSVLQSRDIKKKKKKSRDITLPTKVRIVKAEVFPVVMYGWLNGISESVDMSEQTAGDNEGLGILACCSSWGHKESDTT